MKTSRLAIGAIFGLLLTAGCSGLGSSPRVSPQLSTPQSVSPALIAPAPMAKTAILPASVMMSATRKPETAIQGTSWTQIPGSASLVVVDPGGSVLAALGQAHAVAY